MIHESAHGLSCVVPSFIKGFQTSNGTKEQISSCIQVKGFYLFRHKL